jgi:hypothetical protein
MASETSSNTTPSAPAKLGLKLVPTCWAISMGKVSTSVPPISEGVT